MSAAEAVGVLRGLGAGQGGEPDARLSRPHAYRQHFTLGAFRSIAPCDTPPAVLHLCVCAGEVLSGLGLTRLELGWETLAGGPADLIAVDLRHISTLTALDDLHICSGLPEGRDAPSDSEDEPTAAFTASMLQPLSRRTSLQLDGDGADVFVEFEPHALRGKPSMQHLSLPFVYFEVDGQPDESAVFAELRQLRELTHLDLQRSFFGAPDGSVLPAAACTSLAASSKLQHLDISSNTFPLGLWRELFNPSRQLLQLQVLDIARTNYKSLHEDSDLLLTAADAQRLASCCPGLQHLSAYGTLRDTAAVAALSPLSSSLRTLLLAGTGVPWAKLRNVAGTGWAKAVAQLPSLENLDVTLPVQGEEMERAWVHLKPVLQHLTRLEIWDDNRKSLAFKCKVRKVGCTPARVSQLGCASWQPTASYTQAT